MRKSMVRWKCGSRHLGRETYSEEQLGIKYRKTVLLLAV
jgi:hypothetical protein